MLCCESTNGFNVCQGNFSFWDNLESNVGEKVWKVISNLVIVSKDKSRYYKKKISEM